MLYLEDIEGTLLSSESGGGKINGRKSLSGLVLWKTEVR